ncbi:MAG: hypothetical protein KKB59_18330 [Spirochaetes bacterium]|nr:hypothetical protein [Spirochaetota bacterium]
MENEERLLQAIETIALKLESIDKRLETIDETLDLRLTHIREQIWESCS